MSEPSNDDMIWCFFDLGSTLEDESQAQCQRAHQTVRLLKKHRVRMSADSFIQEMVQTASLGASNIYDATLARFGLSSADISRIRANVRWDKTRLSLYQDARPILRTLSQVASLGLVANQSHGSPSRLREYGIFDFFQVILTSAECGVSKPDPRIYHMAEESAMVSPELIWMVGDRPDNDIAPAKLRGWNTVRIIRGQHRLREPRNEMELPTATIVSLSELRETLQTQRSR